MVDPREPGTGSGRPGAACQLCGTAAPESTVTWMIEHGPRGTVVTCPECARAHLRSIESKLDVEYW